jgi:predicted ATPase with chaperone activity
VKHVVEALMTTAADSAFCGNESLLQTFLADERFWPEEPKSLAQTGLPSSLVEGLACKHLALVGTASGRTLAEKIGLPFRIVSEILGALRTRQSVVYSGSAPFNDYYYMLTEDGQERTKAYQHACAYVGPAPVPLKDYVVATEAQGIRGETPSDAELAAAFADISVDENLFDQIGPAINSGAGMFLFGSPGNGKSTLAKRIPLCFGQAIWIPRALIEDDQIIKLFDACYHDPAEEQDDGILRGRDYDRRWVRIARPTVCVGGELTLDDLEIRIDPVSHVSEAPLQVKANGGCLLIDDFGRQRIEPAELLNRWIIPLENGIDFLRLATGKKIQVPFELLIIFSTNLEPRDLVDEAFLRRIPYKIEVGDPSEEEFLRLFELCAEQFGCEHRPDVVRQLLESHYRGEKRRPRRCHPRDLLKHIRSYCRYKRIPFEVTAECLDRATRVYFGTLAPEM